MTSQRAAVAVELKPMYEAQAKERMRAAGGDRGNQHTGGKVAVDPLDGARFTLATASRQAVGPGALARGPVSRGRPRLCDYVKSPAHMGYPPRHRRTPPRRWEVAARPRP